MDIKIEVLNYIKDRYIEEQSRFTHFEEKCGKIVTLLTIIIGVFASLVGFKSQTLFGPSGKLDWVILLACSVIAFAMACSWGHALRALKLGECPVAAKSKSNAEYLFTATEEDAFKQIIDCYVDTTEKLTKVIDEKATNLEQAYKNLVLSAWSSIFLVILLVIKELSV
ncbi:MAG: hypothetical protein JXB25_09000 [Deltaproteobacteria bacterium]|nr:hypothetical protein [Deltaproteobacteria bacterium]